jgi:hypothetical protein
LPWGVSPTGSWSWAAAKAAKKARTADLAYMLTVWAERILGIKVLTCKRAWYEGIIKSDLGDAKSG